MDSKGVAMDAKPRSVLGMVFLVVFIDLMGFSIIFPLFPEMMEHYLEREGAGSLVGRLVASLEEFAGSNENAVYTLFGGVLGSLYSLLQFLFAPIWGAISDRHGRRWTLLVTLTGTLLSYVAWFFAGSFAVLIVARLLGGIMAGNVSTASAVVADVTSGRERAKGMGILGMAIGLGFILGPAVGGIASLWDLTGGESGSAALAINPFSAAALAAFVLSLLNLVWVARRFPETHPPERRGSGAHRPRLSPFGALKRLRIPGVARATWTYFTYLLAFAAMEFTLTFLAFERLGFDATDNAWMFVFVGLILALVQGGLVRRVAPRYGDKRVALAGLALTVPGFVLVGAAQSTGSLYAGLFFLAFGSGFVMPTLSSLLSRYTPPDRQGLALGGFRSAGAMSRAIGPILGGLLYFRFGSGAPYWAAAVFMLLPLALALRLPPVPPEPEAAEPGPEPA